MKGVISGMYTRVQESWWGQPKILFISTKNEGKSWKKRAWEREPHYLDLHACMSSLFGRVKLFTTPWAVACQAPFAHGILQARILECVAMTSSREFFLPRDWNPASYVSFTGRWFLYHYGHLGSPFVCKLCLILWLTSETHMHRADSKQSREAERRELRSSAQSRTLLLPFFQPRII